MTLAEQLACVEREIERLGEARNLHSIKAFVDGADHELACMRAVAETLRGLMNGADSERLDWLELETKKSRTGISFDWVPSVDGEPRGFRFMRHFFIGEAESNIRSAIDTAMRGLMKGEGS